MPKDHYFVLGVSRGAGLSQIKRAYRRIAKQCHPDLTRSGADADRFIEAKEAYETLADAGRRRSYDSTLEWGGHPLEGGGPRFRTPVRRRSTYREMEAQAAFIDEIFAGLVPTWRGRRPGPSPEKDLCLELVLSPGEAREGGLFPIRFPVLERCPRCDRDDLLGLIGFLCPECRGRGAVWVERRFSLSIPPRIAHGTEVSLSLEDIGAPGVRLHVWVQVDPSMPD